MSNEPLFTKEKYQAMHARQIEIEREMDGWKEVGRSSGRSTASGKISNISRTPELCHWSARKEGNGTEMADQELIDALRLGEAACLTALALEPLSSNWPKWEKAANKIKVERERLEKASLTTVRNRNMSERSEQVSKQYLAVAHMAGALARVHSDLAEIVKHDDDPNMIKLRGNRSARIMELLGNALNGMDAVDRDEDAWLDPVFEAAQQMFPQPAED